jgi:hypothetical protein
MNYVSTINVETYCFVLSVCPSIYPSQSFLWLDSLCQVFDLNEISYTFSPFFSLFKVP